MDGVCGAGGWRLQNGEKEHKKKGFRKRMKGRMIRLKEGWRGVGGKERYLT